MTWFIRSQQIAGKEYGPVDGPKSKKVIKALYKKNPLTKGTRATKAERESWGLKPRD